jgi:hypothetical protein
MSRRALDPVAPELVRHVEAGTRLVRFNVDRLDPASMFVPEVDDIGRFIGWMFIGSASCAGNVFALMAEAGLDLEAEQLELAWFSA